MSDHDRGAYTPQTDAPLAFDARSPQARRPLPFALIASGAVLLVLIGSVALYYKSGNPSSAAVSGGQQVAAVKTAPPAGEQKDAADYLEVYAAQNVPSSATPTEPAFAPPPEQPQPRPAPGLKVQPTELPPLATPAAPPAPPMAKPIEVATIPVKPALPVPPPPKPVPATPAVAAAPAPAAAPAAPIAAASAGGALVQIGAFSSNALADKGWKDIAAAFPSQMAGKAKRVEPLAKGASTLYRTSITGFSDRASAAAFCAQLKAAGRACFVKG